MAEAASGAAANVGTRVTAETSPRAGAEGTGMVVTIEAGVVSAKETGSEAETATNTKTGAAAVVGAGSAAATIEAGDGAEAGAGAGVVKGLRNPTLSEDWHLWWIRCR